MSLPLLVEKAPFFALTIASCAITYLGVKAGGNIISSERVPWSLRLANVPVSYARYLGKLIWPTDLIALYPMPSHWAGWQVGGAVLVLVLISLFVALRARGAPFLIVGWLFFLGILVPTIGIVQAGFQSIADRYTYIPSIGIFIAVVWAVAEWAEGNSRAGVSPAPPSVLPEASGPKAGGALGRRGVHAALLTGVAAVLLLLCGYSTWVQTGYWRDSLALWTHCLRVCPENVVAHYNLGYVLQHSNKTSEAMDHYRAALQFKPDHLDANLNLGIALIGVGRAQEATNYLAAALRIKPNYARAQGAMGLALYELGNYAAAVVHCAEAIRLDPDAFGPYVDMGRALSSQGKSDDALRYYAEGLRLNPALPQTHYYLGLEWMKRGMFDQAAASFGEAVRLAPTWAQARAQQQRALNEAEQTQIKTDTHR
jgi:Tfp pilus assembly protein PilF